MLALTLLGCGHRSQGSPCDDEPNECIDAATLWDCRSSEWSRVACDDYCSALDQASVGCIVGESGDACHCAPADGEGPACDPETASPARCTGTFVREGCIDGVWTKEVCRGFCGTSGQQVGCFYDTELNEARCSCLDWVDPCSAPGYPVCLGEDYIFRCSADELGNEHWSYATCDEVCAPLPAIACVEDDDLVGACLCADETTSTG